MKLTHLVLAGLAATALFTMTPAHAQVFADWTFTTTGTGTGGAYNTPIADTGIDGQTVNGGNNTAVAAGLGMTNTFTSPASVNTDDVLLGKTSDTGSNTVADLTNTWRVRGAGASPNTGNGWSSAAAIGTQGAQFSASTVGASAAATAIKVSFDFYETSAGEANLEFLYTTNGGSTWNNLALTLAGSDTDLSNKTNSTSANTVNGAYVQATAGQNWFTGLTAVISDPNALNDSGFGVEMVNASTGGDDITASGALENNTSGNWRFDNIEIQAVPEPSACLLGLGAAALFAVIAVRRKRA